MSGCTVAILQINTALFARGDDDYGRLWIGRRALRRAAKDLGAAPAELKIAAMHRPLTCAELHHGEQAVLLREISRQRFRPPGPQSTRRYGRSTPLSCASPQNFGANLLGALPRELDAAHL